MTWTYTGDPRSSSTDAVHFLIGDTNPTDQLVADEEILYLLAVNSPILAAAAACETLASKFARMVDSQVGDVSLKASSRSKQYGDMAIALRARAAREGLSVIFGGQSVSTKYDDATNIDQTQPAFTANDGGYPNEVAGMPRLPYGAPPVPGG